jgi:thiamine kinase-like enzyme
LQEFYETKKADVRRTLLEPNLRELIIKNIEVLRENNIPFVFIHGDYVPYNMKVRNDKLALIDWEYSSESGLPLFDLFTFIYQGGYQIFNKKIEFLIYKILDRSGRNYNYFKKYLEKLNIDVEMISPLFVIYLTESLLLHFIRRSDADIKNNQFYHGLNYLLKNNR